MHVIVCVDDRMGMLFNKRRQSQDQALRQELMKLGAPLRMNAYSAKQFGDCPGIAVSEDFLDTAGPGDLCFVEDRKLLPYREKIESITLCRWNRAYPGDFRLDLIPTGDGRHLAESRGSRRTALRCRHSSAGERPAS